MPTSPKPPVERAVPPAAMIRVGNRLLSLLLSSPRTAARVGQALLLLHVTGRRTGRVYSTPVSYHREADGRLLVVTSSRWRVNLRGGPTHVEVTLLGDRMPAVATLEEDPEVVAGFYERVIDELGHEKAARRLGIRITVPRAPTHEELVEAARREHLSLLHLDVGARQP